MECHKNKTVDLVRGVTGTAYANVTEAGFMFLTSINNSCNTGDRKMTSICVDAIFPFGIFLFYACP
jgi:hypothetical protein